MLKKVLFQNSKVALYKKKESEATKLNIRLLKHLIIDRRQWFEEESQSQDP